MSYVETRTVVLPLKFKRQGENPSIQCAASARPFRCDGCVSLRFRLAVSPLPFCFPDHCWRETSTSGFLHFDLLVSPFSLPFSSIFQEASVSPCRGGLGLVVVRGLWRLRAMSVVHCPNLMREMQIFTLLEMGPCIPPKQKMRIKCTGRHSFRLVRNSLHTTSSVATLFFHFSSSAHNVL